MIDQIDRGLAPATSIKSGDPEKARPMTTQQILDELDTLPTESRAMVADHILRSLHSTSDEVDRAWAQTGQRRLNEIKSGQVETISGDQVRQAARKRLQR